tara:strand:+ start:367 stop:1083 length:717 start_codon:yes stop_codon:yes gene_type:complete
MDVTYPIYSKSEADEREIDYKPWKECKKGDFGISDDQYVAECVRRTKYKELTEIQFAFATAFITPRAKLLWEPRRETGNYSSISTKSYQLLESKTSRTKRAVDVYVRMLLDGGGIDWNLLGKIYRKDQRRPDLSAKRLFKQEEVKRMVDKRIQNALKEKGISEGDVLDVISDAISIAKGKEDASTMLRGAETYVRILDMLPKKAVQTDTVQIDMTNQILDDIEKEEKRLKLEQKKELT